MNRKTNVFGGAVKARHRKGVNLGVARTQILYGRIRHAVAVGAVSGKCQGAQIAGRTGNRRLKRCLMLVHVGDRELARVGQVAG